MLLINIIYKCYNNIKLKLKGKNMQIKTIEILKYKSINTSVAINFNYGEPITLIGKNGSGKTNILEALYAIFKSNTVHYYPLREAKELKYKVYLHLDEAEIKALLPNLEYDTSSNDLVVYNDGTKIKVNTLASNIIVPALKNNILDIKEIAIQLKNALCDYIDIVTKIASDDRNKSLSGFMIKSDHITNYWQLKTIIDNNCKQAIELVDKIIANFNDDNTALHFISENPIYFYNLNALDFKLEYHDPGLSEFEQKYIQIDTRALKGAITRLNKQTEKACKAISKLSNELAERANRINNALTDYTLQLEKEDEKYYKFLAEIKKCIGRDCLFLKNDNTDLIFSQKDDRYYERANTTRYIIETCLQRVYNGDNKAELIKALNEGKEINLTDNDIAAFEQYLNSNIPDFDKGMFKAIHINHENSNINIVLEENGANIDLNNTSAGRRWYFTYYFMKNTLKPNDVFIIDEPAGMLHPSAQQEILQELITLAEKGIIVIYSTHSAYMIPDNFSAIHNVEISGNGTIVNTYDRNDNLRKAIINELGIQRTAEILFNLSKTTLLVEGYADEICIKKFAEILHRDLSNYTIFDCRGQPILDVIHLCIEWNVKFKALLDRDTIDESRAQYLEQHGYKSYVAEVQTNHNCIFTPANGERKSLEDCFSVSDQAKCFAPNDKGQLKISPQIIKQGIEFTDETLKNFEQLFNKLGIPKLDKTN